MLYTIIYELVIVICKVVFLRNNLSVVLVTYSFLFLFIPSQPYLHEDLNQGNPNFFLLWSYFSNDQASQVLFNYNFKKSNNQLKHIFFISNSCDTLLIPGNPKLESNCCSSSDQHLKLELLFYLFVQFLDQLLMTYQHSLCNSLLDRYLPIGHP